MITRPGPAQRARIAAFALLLPLAFGLLATYARFPAPRVQAIALDSPPDAMAVDPRTDRAVVGSAATGTVSLLDLTRGRVLRTVPLDHPDPLVPLVLARDPATHHLFVASRTDRPGPSVIQMLDDRTGARLASLAVGQMANTLAVDARHGRVLVADAAAGTLSLLDARTGALQRTTPLGLLPLAVAVDERTARAFVVGPVNADVPAQPAQPGGWDYGLLGVLDTRSGALLGRIPVGSGPTALAVDAQRGRVVVACTGDATVRLLDARSGTSLRTVRLDAAPAALAVDERRGRVYAVSAAGTLSLLDARTGAPLVTRRIDPTADPSFALPDALAVDEARDRVYLSTWGPLTWVNGVLTLRGDGTLYVLDARTGAVLRRMAVGVAPRAVGVDERSGQVVVVNGGGQVLRPPADWGALWIGRLRQWLPWLGRGAAPQPTTERVPGSVSLIGGAP
jgi:DNA-binding beta-propeller fold protein YncE